MVHLILGAMGVAGAMAIMNAKTAGVARSALREVFAVGMSDGYWMALVATVDKPDNIL